MKHRLATAVVALTLVVAATGTVSYRYAHGTWWQTSQRIGYCDRTYLGGTAVHNATEIRQVDAKRGNPALPCSMGIYLQTGPNSYLAYGLSGGL